MADDAHEQLRERWVKAEKRTLAWVYSRRPELQDKSLVEVIAALRNEARTRSKIEAGQPVSDAVQPPGGTVFYEVDWLALRRWQSPQ